MARRFGAKSTGDEVLQGVDLSGKVAVVTGVVPQNATPCTAFKNSLLQTRTCCTQDIYNLHADAWRREILRRGQLHLRLKPVPSQIWHGGARASAVDTFVTFAGI